MSDLGGTDQDADTDVTITSTRDEDEDGDGVLSPRQDKGDGGESEPSDEDNELDDYQPEHEEYEYEDASDEETLALNLLEDDDPRGKKRAGKKRKSGSVGANRREGRGNKRQALSKNISSDGQR